MYVYLYCIYYILLFSNVFVSVVYKNISYDGVQVYIRNNASVCTNG